ncbi:unnamed protein product, partial [Polarella glacialis]
KRSRLCLQEAPGLPEAPRERPEHVPLGLEALLQGDRLVGGPLAVEAREAAMAFGQVAALAAEAADTLEELWAALEASGDSLSAEAAAAALRRLPALLGAAALADAGGHDGLTAHLEQGAFMEAAALPASRGGVRVGKLAEAAKVSHDAFVWAHERVEAELDTASQGSNQGPSLLWLAEVASFYGALRPGPPLPRHVLEDCADLAVKRLEAAAATSLSQTELAQASRVALGAALSGSLGCHGIYSKVALLASTRLRKTLEGPESHHHESCLPWKSLHDISLALALVRPWDAETAAGAAALQRAVVQSLPPAVSLRSGAAATHIAGATCAGMRVNKDGVKEEKENQDAFDSCLFDDGSVAGIIVVDGHGKKGAAVAATARDCLSKALAGLRGGHGTGQAISHALLHADADLLLHEQVDSELSGASGLMLRIEGLGPGSSARKLAVAHVGDCRAVIGRVKLAAADSGQEWKAVRLTEDHRPGESGEAARLVAAGGRVRKAPAQQSQGAELLYLGPPRLWHRQQTCAPGLAMSRGLGDTLGKACGLSPEASVTELELSAEDAVVVVGSDGIFDMLSDAEVLHCCRHFASSKDAAGAAAAVVSAAGRIWDR